MKKAYYPEEPIIPEEPAIGSDEERSTQRPEIVEIVPGRMSAITVGYSEVASHLGVAGTQMNVVLLFRTGHTPMVQLYDESGRPVSFPVLAGEAGVYYRHDGTFYATLLVR
jgi:hypothetical protein